MRATSRLGLAVITGAALLDTFQEAKQQRPAPGGKERRDGVSVKIVTSSTKEFGGGKITLNNVALEIDEKITNWGEVEKLSIKTQFVGNRSFIVADFLDLQIKFHLMHLQFMEQFEGVFRTFGIAGEPVQKAKGVNAHRPLAL